MAILTCTAKLKSISPISFSARIVSVKDTGEGHDDFEKRTWRERLHVNSEGFVFIPPMALKNCLAEVAKYLGESVPGKKSATWTKHFEAGILVPNPLVLGIKAMDVEGEPLYVPANGRRGGGARVWRTFPLIREWTATAEIIALEPLLVDRPEKIEEYLTHAGKFIGMGRFRPRNNGFYGRFEVESFKSVKH